MLNLETERARAERQGRPTLAAIFAGASDEALPMRHSPDCATARAEGAASARREALSWWLQARDEADNAIRLVGGEGWRDALDEVAAAYLAGLRVLAAE